MEAIRSMPDFSIPEKEEFRVREVARILGVSHHTINIAIDQGDIQTVQGHDVLGRVAHWKVIPRSEVIRLAQQKGLM